VKMSELIPKLLRIVIVVIWDVTDSSLVGKVCLPNRLQYTSD
jgi:hypothetical protein